MGHGPELFRVGQVGADQLCQTVYGIRCLCQLVPGVKLQIPPLAAAHGIDEDHGKALGGGLRGAETTGLGEHQVRCIHIGGDILGEAQDPEIGPVAQLQKALVKLFVVAADDDEHAILRQHFRQAAGQTLDGAAAHASAHEKGHPLVRRDAEGGPAFRTAAGCEEDLTHGDAGGDEPLFGNAAPGEFVCQLFVRDKVAVCLGLGHIGAAGVVRGYQIVGDGDGIILTDPAHHQTGKDMGADHGVIASSLQGGVQLLRPQRQGFVHHGGILRRWIVIFGHAVAGVEQQGGTLVDSDVPVADEFGDLGR